MQVSLSEAVREAERSHVDWIDRVLNNPADSVYKGVRQVLSTQESRGAKSYVSPRLEVPFRLALTKEATFGELEILVEGLKPGRRLIAVVRDGLGADGLIDVFAPQRVDVVLRYNAPRRWFTGDQSITMVSQLAKHIN